MSAATVKVDAMGFAEAAKVINREIADRVVDVAIGVRKAHAMLSTLKFRMENNTAGWTAEDIDEISDMVDMTLMMLPHHYTDLNGPIDLELRKLTVANEACERELERRSVLLDAMTAVAQPDATLSELQAHATAVYEIAQKCPEHEPDWLSLLDTLEARGFVVKPTVVGVLDLGPELLTPDMLPKRKKVLRKVDELVAATRELNPSATPPVSTPARKGRAAARGARHA